MANARYKATPTAIADGSFTDLLTDAYGRLQLAADINFDNASINVDGVTHGGVEATVMQSAAVAVGNGTSIDVSGLETVLLYVSGITTAAITVESELPASTWSALPVKSVATGQLSSTITGNGLYVVHVSGALNVRARISSWTSGTITVTGTATAAGNHADVQNVGLREILMYQNDSVLSYPAGHSSSYISTATTTTAKTGAGVLSHIVLGETAAGAITIYDNTAASGTVIGVLKASIAEGTYTFNATFTTGLTIVTAAASKLTALYR